jgi:Uncharacterized conserved protein, contains double-stranded beta-helix domain
MFLRTLAMAAAVATLATPAATLAAGQDHETVRPVFQHAIPNIPGKSLVSVLVDYPPGAKSAPHTHAKSAFIYAHVLSGAVRSKVDDGPAKVYRAGESFFEPPGAHHGVSENASTTEPAQLLAVFVVDTDESALTTPDQH